MCDSIPADVPAGMVPGRMTLNYRRPAKKLAEIRKMIQNLKGTGSVIIVDKYTNDICAVHNKMPDDVDWNMYCVYECIKE